MSIDNLIELGTITEEKRRAMRKTNEQKCRRELYPLLLEVTRSATSCFVMYEMEFATRQHHTRKGREYRLKRSRSLLALV